MTDDDTSHENEDVGPDGPWEDPVAGLLGRAISMARKRAGITQTELARRVGVDQSMVSMWARGRASPPLERILSLDRALGLRPGTLLEQAGLTERPTLEEWLDGDKDLIDDARRRVLDAYAEAKVNSAQTRLATVEAVLERERGAVEYYRAALEAAKDLGDPDREERARRDLTEARTRVRVLEHQWAKASAKVVDVMAELAGVGEGDQASPARDLRYLWKFDEAVGKPGQGPRQPTIHGLDQAELARLEAGARRRRGPGRVWSSSGVISRASEAEELEQRVQRLESFLERISRRVEEATSLLEERWRDDAPEDPEADR